MDLPESQTLAPESLPLNIYTYDSDSHPYELSGSDDDESYKIISLEDTEELSTINVMQKEVTAGFYKFFLCFHG